jgi:hypothetical protein
MPMYPPPMMGGMGHPQGNERNRANFLYEDDEFWTVPAAGPPPVIGG